MTPWYRGYTGSVKLLEETNTYLFTGNFKAILPDTLEISELPIRKWTRDYKKFLEELAQKDEIDKIREHHSNSHVKFVLKVPNLKKIMDEDGGIEKKFKLTSTISANNMVLFNAQSRLKKYANECEILQEYFPVRYELYGKRKTHQLGVMRKDLKLMENKCRFIEGVNNNDIHLRDKSKAQIVAQLTQMKFCTDYDLSIPESPSSKNGDTFDYLLNMPLYSLTKEKVEEMRDKIVQKRTKIEDFEGLTIEHLWLTDLDKFE